MRRTWLLAVSLLVLLAGCDGSRVSQGDADPGGRILAALKSIEAAVPDVATQHTAQYAEAQWDSCDGRTETAGWSDIAVYISFQVDLTPETLLQHASERMQAAGWLDDGAQTTPLGPVHRWARVLEDGTRARATLAPSTSDGTTIVWQLSAIAPPHGQRVSGC